jgi:hypothetical protein
MLQSPEARERRTRCRNGPGSDQGVKVAVRWRTAVEHYAGIDVSLEFSSVCVVDGRGKIVKEAKVGEPERQPRTEA